MAETVLQVDHVSKYFAEKRTVVDLVRGRKQKYLKAVDDVSFSIEKGQNLGLVGESGCGKSTLAKCVLRLYKPTKGRIVLDGTDITSLEGEALRNIRPKMQMVFQDPYASLDPRMTVSDIIAEGMDVHHLYQNKAERAEKIYGLLEKVGLNKEHANRFIHEFSGGQRQRIGIARALAMEPKFLVMDEPISALDVSIQAQVINMLIRLQKEMGLTYLFVAHDLSMVKHISDRVAVMYLGQMVEKAPSDKLFKKPMHPYTQALLSAIPIADPEVRMNRITMKGELTSPVNPEKGCRFAKRCPYATDACRAQDMVLTEEEPGHFVTCLRVQRGEI